MINKTPSPFSCQLTENNKDKDSETSISATEGIAMAENDSKIRLYHLLENINEAKNAIKTIIGTLNSLFSANSKVNVMATDANTTTMNRCMLGIRYVQNDLKKNTNT